MMIFTLHSLHFLSARQLIVHSEPLTQIHVNGFSVKRVRSTQQRRRLHKRRDFRRRQLNACAKGSPLMVSLPVQTFVGLLLFTLLTFINIISLQPKAKDCSDYLSCCCLRRRQLNACAEGFLLQGQFTCIPTCIRLLWLRLQIAAFHIIDLY